MKSVTRYDLQVYTQGGGEVVVSDSGEFVDYDDYQKLVAENAALKELSSYVGMQDDYINYDRVMELRKVVDNTEAAISEDLDSFDDDAEAALNDWLNIKP
jgi:hypothetical protein